MCNRMRISASEAGLARGLLMSWRIPPPTMASYRPFSSIVPRSDGGDAAHGYASLPIMWGVLSIAQYYQLRRIVDPTRPGLIYVTFELNDGTVPSGIYVDASGKAQFLQQSSESPYNRVGPAAVQNVTLTINNVTIINNPSNYS